MVLLQSNDKYDELAEYDHSKGTFIISSRKNLDDKALLNTDGMFSILSTIFVALYRYKQQLILRIGNKNIILTDDTFVSVSGNASNRLLIIKEFGKEIIRLNYELDISKQFPNDPTPFVGDEDFDFGLFVSNIANDDKRKKIFLAG
ncbi:MAG: hypothetical protein CTY16_06195 [Methylobacter sp.]|nr:MAG: hypothetical protein CTY16_06195 [Methylobacter sp.]